MKTAVRQKNKNLKIYLVFYVAMAVISFGLGWYFTFGFSKEVSKILTEVKFLDKESEQKTDVAQKYNRVSEYEGLVFDTMPTSKEISSYLADVENIAVSNGLVLTNTTVGKSGSAAKSKTKDLDLSQTINQKDYYELPISYTVQGSYQSFLKMLTDLQNLRRLNVVSDIDITKDSNDISGDTIQVSFTDSIYIKK